MRDCASTMRNRASRGALLREPGMTKDLAALALAPAIVSAAATIAATQTSDANADAAADNRCGRWLIIDRRWTANHDDLVVGRRFAQAPGRLADNPPFRRLRIDALGRRQVDFL